MTSADILRLVALAAIWGASFIFLRLVAPALGSFLTADLRLLLAGLALILYFKVTRFDVRWREFWKQYLTVGTLNSAVPFTLYSFAALHIPASLSVILNSASPLFGAVFSAYWLGEKLTLRKMLGLALGFIGVSLVAKLTDATPDPLAGWAIAACLLAAACYGLTGVYIKTRPTTPPSKAIAGASQVMAGLVLSPSLLFLPPVETFSSFLILNILALALVCSGIAYLLYYRLIADVGPTKALTVTFLMPAFGMLWGVLFLGETVTARMALGAALVVAGTFLVLRASPSSSLRA